MDNFTVRQRIIVSFAVILALVSAMGGISFMQLLHIERETSSLEQDSLPGFAVSAEIRFSLNRDYLRTAELLLEDDRTKIAEAADRIQSNRTALDELFKKYEATIFTEKDRANFDVFMATQVPYRQIQTEAIRLHLNGQGKEARTLVREQLEPAFEKAREAIQTITEFNKTNADVSGQNISGSTVAAKWSIEFALAIVAVIAVASGYLLYRAITGPLQQLLAAVETLRAGDFRGRLRMTRQDEFGILAKGFDEMTDALTALIGEVQRSGIQVNTSVTEISASYKEQQATATETAATTSEIGATSREISATSRELVKTMNQVAGVAEQTSGLATNGQVSLSRMEDAMRHLIEATSAISAKLAVLNEKAGNINQVVTTITKVADQTNLLSLNAAIEAEKAGEYGRGFAVVATEIRRLADQTAVATYDIDQMVKEIQSAVSAGVMGMDKFSEEVRRSMHEVEQISSQLSQIIHQVQAMVPQFEAVNEGMQAQATGAEQISESLVQLSEAAQQTVQSLQQSNQVVGEMTEVSGRLRESVSGFKLLHA